MKKRPKWKKVAEIWECTITMPSGKSLSQRKKDGKIVGRTLTIRG